MDLGKNLSEEEQNLIDTIIKRSETECIQCVMWDESAKFYEKYGMCEECFNKKCVAVKEDF
jgi:hypothetical protein